MTCPYHAWTYAIDGKLIGVALNDAFDNLDKSSRNLVELESREWGGIIYAQLNRDIPADWSQLSQQVADDFTALGIADAHVYGRKTFDLKANWKVVSNLSLRAIMCSAFMPPRSVICFRMRLISSTCSALISARCPGVSVMSLKCWTKTRMRTSTSWSHTPYGLPKLRHLTSRSHYTS